MIAKRRKKKTKDGSKTISLAPLFLLGVFCLIGLSLLISNWRLAQRHCDLSLKTNELEKEIALLERKNEDLKTGLASLEEQEYLEKEAREKFQLAKPGEKVVVVVPPEDQTEQVSAPAKKNIFQAILEKLGL